MLKRITFKGLASDFYDHYFNLDNTFLQTFRDLFVKPGAVLQAYIEGVRRRYVNPMNYLAIALALSGILLFVMKWQIDKIDMELFGFGMGTDATRKIMDVTIEYNALIFLLYIPIIALAGYLVLNKNDYNLPEYTTAATYVLAHYSIFSFPISLVLLVFAPEGYMGYSLIGLLMILGYTLYALGRFNGGKLRRQIFRMSIFIILFLIGYFGISLLLNLIFFLTGILELKDFVPNKGV
ncbi:DUF3667 domain-containing protein [Robiginitalea sp. IMCC43444]|uniref:DUF3667 domain-containing protein n=1 Tax=Robiginitalea sp. IMCC43444 TaxID=3459121 RepID=UPI0040419967